MVDIHKPGDHRIILGDSLRDDNTTLSHIGVRYNWMPKAGLEDTSGTIKGTNDNLKLSYCAGSKQYDYSGWLSGQDREETPELVLIYDKEKSAYVLERLAASVDANLQSGSELSSDFIKRQARLQRVPGGEDANGDHAGDHDLFDDGEDTTADASNPFDFRHFLGEAKEAVEKQAQHGGGGRTPLPGGRTPMSSLGSPLIGAHHHNSTTPSFGPTEIKSATNKPQEWAGRRRKKDEKATRPKSSNRGPTATSAKPKNSTQTRQPKPLSQEKVLDSDSDENSSAEVSDRPSPAAAPAKKPTKSHHRHVSSASAASATQSPRIVVDDDFEIDTGSPPPETRKRGYRIDPNAFRSQTGTPQPGRSTDRRDADIEMRDADDEEEDENAKYFQDDSDEDDGALRGDADADIDVDELILDEGAVDSPSPPPLPIQQPKPKRRKSSTVKRRSNVKSPSPPPLQQASSVEEDDGGLAAELEAALEKEQQMQDMRMHDGEDEEDVGGAGLGISSGVGQEDESDISEED